MSRQVILIDECDSRTTHTGRTMLTDLDVVDVMIPISTRILERISSDTIRSEEVREKRSYKVREIRAGKISVWVAIHTEIERDPAEVALEFLIRKFRDPNR